MAFHPDRARLPEARAAWAGYCKAVAGAVEYLKSGELEFELASEKVPSRRNFMVELKRQATQQQAAADEIAAKKNELESKLAELQLQENKRNQTMTKALAETAEAKRYNARLRQSSRRRLRNLSQSFSANMMGREWEFSLRGQEVHFDRWPKTDPTHPNRPSGLSVRVLRWLKHGTIPEINGRPMRDFENRFLEMCGDTESKWQCVRGRVKGGTFQGDTRLLGALPLVNWLEFMWSQADFDERKINSEFVYQTIQQMAKEVSVLLGKENLEQFMLPSVWPGALVVLKTGDIRHFIWAKAIGTNK